MTNDLLSFRTTISSIHAEIVTSRIAAHAQPPRLIPITSRACYKTPPCPVSPLVYRKVVPFPHCLLCLYFILYTVWQHFPSFAAAALPSSAGITPICRRFLSHLLPSPELFLPRFPSMAATVPATATVTLKVGEKSSFFAIQLLQQKSEPVSRFAFIISFVFTLYFVLCTVLSLDSYLNTRHSELFDRKQAYLPSHKILSQVLRLLGQGVEEIIYGIGISGRLSSFSVRKANALSRESNSRLRVLLIWLVTLAKKRSSLFLLT
jgi:hypothetical protein